MTWLSGYMCNHSSVAGEGAQTLLENPGQLTVPARQMFLTVEYTKNNITQTGEGYPVSRDLRPFAPSEIDEVEPAPPSSHPSRP